jgi:hypothetical protein
VNLSGALDTHMGGSSNQDDEADAAQVLR